MIAVVMVFGWLFAARELVRLLQPSRGVPLAIGCVFTFWYFTWNVLTVAYLHGPLPPIYLAYSFITAPLWMAYAVHLSVENKDAKRIDTTVPQLWLVRIDAALSLAMIVGMLVTQ